MTTAPTHRRRAMSRPLGAALPVQPPLLCARVRWSLSRAAVGRAHPGWNVGQGDAPLTLECTVTAVGPDLFLTTATITDASGAARAVALEAADVRRRGAWIQDPAERLEHVDIPGFLALSFRRDAGGSVRVLFARTPLLTELGLPGGRYQVLVQA